MDGASFVTMLGLLFKVFEFAKPKQEEVVEAPETTALAPYDKDAAIWCISIVAIVAIVVIFALASSRQSA